MSHDLGITVRMRYRMKDCKLSDTSRTLPSQFSTFSTVSEPIPDPRSLAAGDSFLNSFAAEPATTSTTAGAMARLLKS